METPSTQRAQPSPLRQELRAKQRLFYRNAILDSSATLLDERGPDDIKMSDIADNAGMSVGALYNYFKSKEELIAAVQRRSVERFLEHLQAPYEVNDHLLQLEEFLRRSLVWCERRVRIDSSRPGILNLAWSHPSHPPQWTLISTRLIGIENCCSCGCRLLSGLVPLRLASITTRFAGTCSF